MRLVMADARSARTSRVQGRIDIARVCGVRKGRQMSSHLGCPDPSAEGQALRFAKGYVEAVGPQGGEAVQAAPRYRARNGRKLKGQGWNGRTQAAEHPVFEALHVDLDELRPAVGADEAVEGKAGNRDRRAPHLLLPPHGLAGRADEGRGCRRNRWVGGVEVKRDCLVALARGGLKKPHGGVAPMKEADDPGRAGLGLECNDTRANAAEG